MSYDREDNNKFVSKITNALRELDARGEKITAIALAKQSRYPLKDIELNLYEIETIMNALGIE